MEFRSSRLPLCAKAEVGNPTEIAALAQPEGHHDVIARLESVRQAYYAANQSALTVLPLLSRGITGIALHC
jgi:hypothetical protein